MRGEDVNDLLREIIRQAELAMRTKNFARQIEEIHRIVYLIERRMKRFEEQQYLNELDRLFKEAEAEV